MGTSCLYLLIVQVSLLSFDPDQAWQIVIPDIDLIYKAY